MERMKKYEIVETKEVIEGKSYCDIVMKYRAITKDNRTYKDLIEEYPENTALITETNQDFSSDEESKCFLIVSYLITLKIICKL